MINQETANIKLTTEQLLQIDSFQKTLANLQSEIDKHSRNLQIVRNDNVALTKEKAYLEGLVVGLKEKKESLEKSNANAESQLENSLERVRMADIENHKLKEDSEEILKKVEEETNKVYQIQSDVNKEREELDKKVINFNEESELLERKKIILTEALNSI